MDEIWKDIEGYEGLYQVSNLGNVYSCKYKKIFKPCIRRKYFSVILSKNKVIKNCYVHRLVAAAFIPNPDNKPQVNHKDLNKLNNELSNLEWVTVKDNIIHGINKGARKKSYLSSAKNNKLRILRLNSGYKTTEIAKILNVSKGLIYHWEHKLCKPSNENLMVLSNLYNTTYEMLWDYFNYKEEK